MPPTKTTPCLLVAEMYRGAVLRFSLPSGHFMDTFVPEHSGNLGLSLGIAIGPGGDVFVSNTFPYDPGKSDPGVLRYDGSSGSFLGSFTAYGNVALKSFGDIAFGPDGNLYAARGVVVFGGPHPGAVLRYNGNTGTFKDWFVPVGSGDLSDGFNLTFGPDGNLYVRSSGENAVLRYDGASGKFDRAFVKAGAGGLEFPWGLAFGSDGNLYVSSMGNDRVLRYDGTTGDFIDEFVANAGNELVEPRGLGFGPDGKLYVCSCGNGSVLRYDGGTGEFLDAVVPTHHGHLSAPIDLAFAEMSFPDIVPESHNLVEILFGVIEGGGGAIRFPRGPILRVGPPQPPVLDVLRALVIHEIAASMSHDARRDIRRAAMQALRAVAEAEIARLERGE